MSRQRVICYIDGFNLYHAIDELRKPHLKWLNIKSLIATNYIDATKEDLVRIEYFSALAKHRHSHVRHLPYLAALSNQGVGVNLGNFLFSPTSCRECGHKWREPKEKKSDVHLASCLVKDAYTDAMDIAILVSNDTDFVPAVKLALEAPKQKRVRILIPPGKEINNELSDAAQKRYARMDPQLMENHLFKKVEVKSDNTIAARRPSEYDPPK